MLQKGLLMELKIDKEFQGIIHPLTSDEFKQLEANILTDGCREPLTVWDGTIIDGHHRYKICQEYGVAFNVHEIQFASREDAIIWMCQNQRGRRNITDEQREYLLGKEYDAKKTTEARNQYTASASDELRQKLGKEGTAQRVADLHGVGRTAVVKSAQFAKGIDAIGEASPAARQKILSGESSVTKEAIRKIHKQTQEEIEVIAQQIATDTYQKPETREIPKLTPKERKKLIDEAIRSMRDPNGKQITSDSHAVATANNLCSYAESIYASIMSDNYPDIEQASAESKKVVADAIHTLETAINTLRTTIQ